MVNAPLPGTFLLPSHELLMVREVFIVETLTQFLSLGVGHDALTLADRLDSSKDLSGAGWQSPVRRVVATLLTRVMNFHSTVLGEGTLCKCVTAWCFSAAKLSWTMHWLNGEGWEVERHVPGAVGQRWAENLTCLPGLILWVTLQVSAGRGKDHLYIKESKNNGSWPLAHPVFWFFVFQHISVSWWQPWVWRLVRIACGATVPTKPSCLCGSFWLQLTPWLSRWGCGCPSRLLASRQLSLLCRDPLSLKTAKAKKKILAERHLLITHYAGSGDAEPLSPPVCNSMH